MGYEGQYPARKKVRCPLECLGMPEKGRSSILQQALSMVAICGDCPNIRTGRCSKKGAALLKVLENAANADVSLEQ
jgi:hypothetical protein